jgi:SAM-dependent methyltransferase
VVHLWHQFDAVWLQFVIVHVPDPEALLVAALKCFKPGGILLVEDCYVTWSIINMPPVNLRPCMTSFTINTLKQHLNWEENNFTRGARIRTYLSNIGMREIECNSFAPVSGLGITIQPWTKVREEDSRSRWLASFQPYELGRTLFAQSMASLKPELR